MKKGKLFLLIFLVISLVIFTKYNGATRSFFLDFINPVKVAYLNLTDISDSYLKQQKNILKLEKDNAQLKKLLIEQSNYIEQLTKIYKTLPSLARKPYKSIYIVDTISYIKLNRLNEIMLTSPKNLKLESNKPYGLMQDDFAAGIARSINGKLHAYLLTHPKCTFSVRVGESGISGIAQGDDKNGMIVKFIPRWSEVKIGDIVKSSGLDNIFFPNIPVGKVVDVKTLDRYKVAQVKIFAKLEEPSIFFLISDPTPYLTTDYMPKTSFPNKVYPFVPVDENENNNTNTTQTKDNIVEPENLNEQDYMKIFKSDFIWNNKLKLDEQ
jgi:rod shape-determining protein MreC